MSEKRESITKDGLPEDQMQSELPADSEYDLPIQLFAGTVIAIMGLLVLATPLVTAMPSDHVLDPTAMNVVSGGIYVAVGVFFAYRGMT
jgi:hypothetical protein